MADYTHSVFYNDNHIGDFTSRAEAENYVFTWIDECVDPKAKNPLNYQVRPWSEKTLEELVQDKVNEILTEVAQELKVMVIPIKGTPYSVSVWPAAEAIVKRRIRK